VTAAASSAAAAASVPAPDHPSYDREHRRRPSEHRGTRLGGRHRLGSGHAPPVVRRAARYLEWLACRGGSSRAAASSLRCSAFAVGVTILLEALLVVLPQRFDRRRSGAVRSRAQRPHRVRKRRRGLNLPPQPFRSAALFARRPARTGRALHSSSSQSVQGCSALSSHGGTAVPQWPYFCSLTAIHLGHG
jgi:hypothetical protein